MLLFALIELFCLLHFRVAWAYVFVDFVSFSTVKTKQGSQTRATFAVLMPWLKREHQPEICLLPAYANYNLFLVWHTHTNYNQMAFSSLSQCVKIELVVDNPRRPLHAASEECEQLPALRRCKRSMYLRSNSTMAKRHHTSMVDNGQSVQPSRWDCSRNIEQTSRIALINCVRQTVRYRDDRGNKGHDIIDGFGDLKHNPVQQHHLVDYSPRLPARRSSFDCDSFLKDEMKIMSISDILTQQE